MSERLIKLLVGGLVFVVLLNLLIGFAVTEKPWYERLYVTAATAISGGGIGAAVGIIVGGIGVALMGTAVGVVGWVLFGVAGFGIGALGGSIYTIVSTPQFYDFDAWKLVLLSAVSASAAWVVGQLFGQAYSKLASWRAKSQDEKADSPGFSATENAGGQSDSTNLEKNEP